MTVIGIDPSLTACGIATLERRRDGTAWLLGAVAVGHPGRDGASYGDRSDRIVSQCRHILTYVPDDTHLVVVEDMPQGIRSMPSLGDRWGLWWGLYSALRSKKIPVAVCNPATRAKWATGHGRSDKADVLAAVAQQWPDAGLYRTRDHDRADAITMAAMGALRLGWTLPFPIKARHHSGLEAVAWPKEIA